MKTEYGRDCRIAETVVIKGDGALILGDWVSIEDFVFIDLSSNPSSVVRIGSRSKLKVGAVLRTYGGTISIGARVSLGEYALVAGHGGVEIEDNVIVAHHTSFNSAQHIFSGDVDTRFQGEVHSGIRVGRGAWVGAGVQVLAGIDVGEGTVVGAGSTVLRSLPKRTVCAGTPCNVIRKLD